MTCTVCKEKDIQEYEIVCDHCYSDLVQCIKELETINNELFCALFYYADPENMDEYGKYGNIVGTSEGDVWELDEGKIARQSIGGDGGKSKKLF